MRHFPLALLPPLLLLRTAECERGHLEDVAVLEMGAVARIEAEADVGNETLRVAVGASADSLTTVLQVQQGGVDVSGNVGVGGALHVAGDVRSMGKIQNFMSEANPGNGIYPHHDIIFSGVVHSRIVFADNDCRDGSYAVAGEYVEYLLLTVHDNSHWGGFYAKMTVFDHYYTPGRKNYHYESKPLAQSSGSRGWLALEDAPTMTRDDGTATSMPSDGDCTIVRKANGAVGGTAADQSNQRYEEQLFLKVRGYNFCSVRIEYHGGAMTWSADPDTVMTGLSRHVRLGFRPFDADNRGSVTLGVEGVGCVP